MTRFSQTAIKALGSPRSKSQGACSRIRLVRTSSLCVNEMEWMCYVPKTQRYMRSLGDCVRLGVWVMTVPDVECPSPKPEESIWIDFKQSGGSSQCDRVLRFFRNYNNNIAYYEERQEPLPDFAKIRKEISSRLRDLTGLLEARAYARLAEDLTLVQLFVERIDEKVLLEEVVACDADKIAACVLSAKKQLETMAIRLAQVLPGPNSNPRLDAEDGIQWEKRKPPIFSGSLKEFTSWWEQFRPNVHQQAKYSPKSKMDLLLLSLKGPALTLVQGFEASGENYAAAVQVLLERYGDPTKLRAIYYEELEGLDLSKPQIAVFDGVRQIVNNLRAIGMLEDETHLKDLVLASFDDTVLQFAVRELISEGDDGIKRASIDEVLTAIGKAVKVEDLVAGYRERRERRTSTTAVLVGQTARPSRQTRPAQKEKNRCLFCGEGHKTEECRRYNSFAARRTQIQRKGLCFGCLHHGHMSTACPRKDDRCKFCREPGHPPALCRVKLAERKAKETRAKTTNSKGMYSQTFCCRVSDPRNAGRDILVRGMFDSGSHESFVSDALVRRLGIQCQKVRKMNVLTFGSSVPSSMECREVLVSLKDPNSVVRTFRFLTTPCITGEFSSAPPGEVNARVLPRHLEYADDDLFRPLHDRKPVDILIGQDYHHSLKSSGEKRLGQNLVLQRSFFGWIVSGSLTEGDDGAACNKTIVALAPEDQSVSVDSVRTGENLETLWSFEVLGIKDTEVDCVDDLVIDNFRKTVTSKDGRYVVCWPWKRQVSNLPTNFRMCVARLKSLVERSPRETILACDALLREQLSLGIIEDAPRSTDYRLHYLPHRPLIHHGKLRIVYDASAKTKVGHSLNDLLHRGPVLVGDLVGLIMNFRLHAVGITADIEKAFLQIEINEVDRDVVRFLWLKDVSKPATPENLWFLRFRRVPFGVVSSPFLLNMVLQELLNEPPINVWHVLGRSSFYVDNLLTSVPSTSEALDLQESLTVRLKSAGFNLRDWVSNDSTFGKAVSDGNDSSQAEVSVLGLTWNRGKDTLSIRIGGSLENERITKRNVLKFLASIFDPLGFFSPSILELKLFIQECWKEKFGWDVTLPSELAARWMKIMGEAKDIASFEVPRRYWNFDGTGKYELHIFCDASKKAYACVAYLVYHQKSNCQSASQLIFSKSRTAPIKEVSIPRLELLGVLMGTRTAKYLSSQLKVTLERTVLWTDATTVLQWLQSTAVLPLFVQNRITEIRRATNLTIRYVPTKENPADIASRGLKASLLKEEIRWWKGPSWLAYERLWPPMPDTTEIYSSDIVTLITQVAPYKGMLTDELEKRFSTLRPYMARFRKIVSFCNLCAVKAGLANPLTSNVEYEMAERLLIKELQLKYFSVEYAELQRGQRPKIQLDLFLDEKGLIRCRGRLENASFSWDTIHPILLPRNSPLTEVYIRTVHVNNFHIGCSHLLAKLRERFWIIKGRAKVKSVLHRCAGCRKVSGGSYQLPPLPPLPVIRVTEASPFLHTGIYLMGPIKIKGARGVLEVHVALFVCLVTRAVHLEVVRDKSTDEFLMALERFTGRRGCPKYILSDNAPQFVVTQTLVGQRTCSLSYKINHFLDSNNILWKFIPQYAPWHGGAYERMVALIKNCLKRSFHRRLLDYVEFNTTMIRIEDTINGRPLTYVSDELLSPLTPQHFLRQRTVNATVQLQIPDPLPSTRENLLEAWGHTREAVAHFWTIFKSQYLTTLRERHTTVHPSKKGSVPYNPRLNEIVLVKDPTAPRAAWKLGRVMSVDKGQRVAEVRMAAGVRGEQQQIFIRAVNHLYPLEIPRERPGAGSQESCLASNNQHNGSGEHSYATQ